MLSLSHLSMRFGAKILFQNVSVQFNRGNRYGLVGANGSGKSTLMKIIIGEVSAEEGEVSTPPHLSIGTLSQDHYRYEKERILDVVLRGKTHLWEALQKKHHLLQQEHFDQRECEQLMELEKTIEEQGGYAAEGEAAKLLEGLGIREEWHTRLLELLSGGYKLRVLLAQVLFSKPDILILDEPTNHLDMYSIKWLELYLSQFEGTVIVSSHDRQFLNGVCTHIADVDYGTIKIYPGNYEAFQEKKAFDREQKELLLDKFEKKREDLQGFIDRFGAKATKARQAQSKARLVDKLEEEKEALNLLPSSRIYPRLVFQPTRSSSITVLRVQELSKSYHHKKVLHEISFEIERGERVAIIGPNGIGKSTFLEIVTENKKCDHGSFQWGFNVKWAYFPQDPKGEVTGEWSLLEWLGQLDREIPQEKLRDTLGSVLFSGDVVNQPVNILSGGETARLVLAKMMLQKPNVLIFDEPTNHLDMEAIEELSKALEAFDGTVVFVSHNRYFVSRLANRIIELTDKGVRNFIGTYPEFLEKQSQEKDYLSRQLTLSQRYLHEKKGEVPSTPSSYQDQKKIKSLKSQLRKKVTQLEERCHTIETHIQKIEAEMGSQGFYEKTTREEQQKKNQHKQELEADLNKVMEEWEKVALELQKYEEEG